MSAPGQKVTTAIVTADTDIDLGGVKVNNEF